MACFLSLAFTIWVVHIIQFSYTEDSYQNEPKANGLDFIVTLGNETIESTLIEPAWTRPLIHIVDTRFMQYQPQLVHLARSRFTLFKAFCLPTILGQTLTKMYEKNKQSMTHLKADPYFLWVIKVDPLFGKNASYASDILESMIELLSPYENFFLVTSNDNYGLLHQKGYGWREGISGASILLDPKSCVLTGDVSILQRAYYARQHRIVLETRLDADDGLNTHYLEMIQRQALEYLSSPTAILSLDSKKKKDNKKRASWMFWCPATQLEWRPAKKKNTDHFGSFHKRREKSFCATPGLTRGIAVGNITINLPSYAHHELYKNVHTYGTCGLKNKRDCLKMISVKNSDAVIRARTITSVGMNRIDVDLVIHQDMPDTQYTNLELLAQNSSKDTILDAFQMQEPWKSLKENFGVNLKSIDEANTYIISNARKIAEDNLDGQCTHGHSCKREAKFLLRKIINDRK